MDEQQANEAISELLAQAEKFLAAAEQIADETGVDFSWSGPAYGMGGYYASGKEEPEWESSGCSDDEQGWRSSSANC